MNHSTLITRGTLALLCAALLPQAGASVITLGLQNGSFETLNASLDGMTPQNRYTITDASKLPGWKTTASDNQVEVWRYVAGLDGSIAAADGQQFAELNANMPATMYQDVTGFAAGSVLGWQFSHRGRLGVDTLSLTITDLGRDGVFGTTDDRVLFTGLFSDDNTTWASYGGTGLQASGDTLRFAFQSVSAAGSLPSYGNFIDAAAFGVGVGVGVSNNSAVPEPATLLLSVTALLAAGTVAGRRLRRPKA